MPNNFKKYHDAVKYLESIINLPQPNYFVKKKDRDIFIKRLEYFLKLLDNPHKNLKYIHVGGTSGKGSVATMIQSILTEAGYKTGLYTSPHPTTSIERIKINNLLISPGEFADLVEKIKPAIDLACQKSPYGRPSYFEILTVIAFLYFKRKKCDYAVLEVGLGGSYDATNVIPPAEITLINLISYDHTDILGKTLAEIAKEKAGIIKPETIFFTTGQNSKKTLDIFKKTCVKNKAEFNLVKINKKIEYPLVLLGEHQQKNAQLAANVGEKMGISNNKIKAGLKKTKLPCRLEIVQKNPTVILDSAHNISKMKTTVETIKNLTYDKLYLIIALTYERSGTKVFKEIKSLADHLYITRYQLTLRKCHPPLELAKKIKFKKQVKIFLDPRMALKQAKKLAKKNDLILITGSFYLAGELRKNWQSENTILKNKSNY